MGPGCLLRSWNRDLKQGVEAKPGCFLDRLMELGHLTPIEHASFSFGIEGVSRNLLAPDYQAPHCQFQRQVPALCVRSQCR